MAGTGNDNQKIGLVTNLISWPEGLSIQLMQSFALTSSEADVLKSLTLGFSVKEIADETGRSEATIRTHVRSLLEKTDARTQMELVRVTLGLLNAVDAYSPIRPMRGPPGVLPSDNTYHTLILADGRKLGYLSIGNAGGRPFLMLPTDGGFTRLPNDAEDWLAESDMLMIVPVRAGYGLSSPLPKDRNAIDVAVADVSELWHHLEIGKAPILAFCEDFHMAVCMANHMPSKVSAIVGVGPTMPAFDPIHFKRMPKWTRFIFANATYAPKALPYVAMALFQCMRRLGPRRFMKTVMSSSAPDTRLLDDDALLETLLRGSEIAVGPKFTAHAAWAAGAIANYGVNWAKKLEVCSVPMILYAGHQDPFAPFETTKEFAQMNSRIMLHEFPEYGQLLYPLWPLFLSEVRRRLDSKV